jgi:CRISPR-associated protein Cmr5
MTAAKQTLQESSKQTLEQKRARHALEKVKEADKEYPEGTDERKNFVGYVESLPAAIHNNGLGQAAATLLAQAKGKKGDPHRTVYNIVEDWLCREDPAAPYKRTGGNTPLMDAIVNGDRSSYIKAQAEALLYLEWLKKFTVAFLKEKE